MRQAGCDAQHLKRRHPPVAVLAGGDERGVGHDVGREAHAHHFIPQLKRPFHLPLAPGCGDEGIVCDDVTRDACRLHLVIHLVHQLPAPRLVARADDGRVTDHIRLEAVHRRHAVEHRYARVPLVGRHEHPKQRIDRDQVRPQAVDGELLEKRKCLVNEAVPPSPVCLRLRVGLMSCTDAHTPTCVRINTHAYMHVHVLTHTYT